MQEHADWKKSSPFNARTHFVAALLETNVQSLHKGKTPTYPDLNPNPLPLVPDPREALNRQ